MCVFHVPAIGLYSMYLRKTHVCSGGRYRMCTISQPGYTEYIVTMDTLKCSPAREWLNRLGDIHNLKAWEQLKPINQINKLDVQAITNLQNALFSAKGKFQSAVSDGIPFICKNIYTKHIYIKSHCMFFRGTGSCVPAQSKAPKDTPQFESSEPLLEE